MHSRPRLLALLLFAASLPCATAQTPQSLQTPQDPHNFSAMRTGEVVDLGPYWLFQEGDNPAWAAGDLDDSKWPVISTNKTLANEGYANVNQIWYRLHVRVPASSGALVLGMTTFYGSYEIFVNGIRIGGEGTMLGRGAYRWGRLIYYGIPKEAVRSGELVIAIHGAVEAAEYVSDPPAAGILPNTRIMISGPVALAPLTFESYIRSVWTDWVFMALAAFVVFVVLALYRALPEQKEYLVIALCGVFHLMSVCATYLDLRLRLPNSGMVYGIGLFAGNAFLALQFEVVLRLVGIRPAAWIRAVQGVLIGSAVLTELRIAGMAPAWIQHVLVSPALIVLFIAVPVYLFREMRRGNRDAPILFAFQIVWSTIELLYEADWYLYKAHLFRWASAINLQFNVGQFSIFANDLATIYFWVTLLVIMVLRTVRISRERAEIASEIAAARTVQKVLIPDFLPPVAGLAVESAYLPAQQVGGDFFQVLPIPGGGDAFIVVGDVSGKGMKAAMTVSLIVGALRTFAEFYTSPAAILAGLNRLLYGRDAGCATCLALKISSAGDVTIANAGHPNPYLDGVEISTEGNLPLGLKLDAVYTETRLHIDPTQSFTLVTDGVVEAAHSTTRELFGFGRTQAISKQAANVIAEAARVFGMGAPQADDITVLTVARV